MREVKIAYFAVLRERTGKSGEVRNTGANSYEELYNELKEAYNFPLDASRVRVAIGESYSEMTDLIQEDAEIVFIPPVAGG